CRLLAGAWLRSASAAVAQGTGTATITGTVTDSASHTGLADVQLSLSAEGAPANGPGTRGARSAVGGKFTITGAPGGAVVVRARLIGYAPIDTRVTTQNGQTTTVNITLLAQTTLLDQVVVTGTAGA